MSDATKHLFLYDNNSQVMTDLSDGTHPGLGVVTVVGNNKPGIGINNNGDIICNCGGTACLYHSSDGSVQTLPGATAYAINNNGQIAGQFGNYAAVYNPTQGIISITTPTGYYSEALGINNNNQVVGDFWSSDQNKRHAFFCNLNLTNPSMVDLGVLGGNSTRGWWSSATSINDDGLVAGDSTVDVDDGNSSHGFFWTALSAQI